MANPLLSLPDPSPFPLPLTGHIIQFPICSERVVREITFFTAKFTIKHFDFKYDCSLSFEIPSSYRNVYVKDGCVCVQASVLGALAYNYLPPNYFAPFYKHVLFPVLRQDPSFPDPSTFYSEDEAPLEPLSFFSISLSL